jgi:hypothetical protein
MSKKPKMRVTEKQCSAELKTISINLEMSVKSFFELAFQKLTLIKLADNLSISSDDIERIDGIINMIDSIQDQAVQNGFNEDIVFPFIGE